MTTPIELEATGATAIVTFKGIEYTIPATRDGVDLEMLEMLEANQVTGALRAILGAEQYAIFRTGAKVPDAGAMLIAIQDVLGLGN